MRDDARTAIDSTRPQARDEPAALTTGEQLATTQVPTVVVPAREADGGGYELVGAVLAGKYRVERVLGAGGMGMVLAVTGVEDGRLHALKFLRPELAREPDVVARFMREAHAASKLRSKHIARVTDVGQFPNGPPFLVMEHLVGEDAAQRLSQSGPLPIAEAVEIVIQACSALNEAHQLGIVHRDLKPANLFLTRRPDGKLLVKVLDFGIAKAAVADDEPGLTTTGAVFGSPAYMSPEQIRSAKKVDARTDIWALGVILHELLSGGLPFDGTTASALLAAASADAPKSLRAARPEVSAALDAVVRRCLEKKPDARFASVTDLAHALASGDADLALAATEPDAAAAREPAASRTAPQTTEVPPSSLKRGVVIASLVLVAAIVLLAIRSRDPARAPALQPAAATAPIDEPPKQLEPANDPAIAPAPTLVAPAPPASSTPTTGHPRPGSTRHVTREPAATVPSALRELAPTTH